MDISILTTTTTTPIFIHLDWCTSGMNLLNNKRFHLCVMRLRNGSEYHQSPHTKQKRREKVDIFFYLARNGFNVQLYTVTWIQLNLYDSFYFCSLQLLLHCYSRHPITCILYTTLYWILSEQKFAEELTRTITVGSAMCRSSVSAKRQRKIKLSKLIFPLNILENEFA